MRVFHPLRPIVPGLIAVLILAAPAHAGKLSWLDEVVQQVVREAEAGGKVAVRAEGRTIGRTSGRLFAREADEGLEAIQISDWPNRKIGL